MTTLKFNAVDPVDVKKTFNTCVVRLGMDKAATLAAMNQNPIAVENADAWYMELQNYVTVSNDWTPGVWYSRGLSVVYNGIGYNVVQDHQSQVGWEPPTVPALFTPIPIKHPDENYPRWRQPTGAQDAYKIDERVTHNGADYKSNMNANVWEPPEQWTVITSGGGTFPAWVQPTGSSDDYAIGARVSHNAKNWESIVNDNVWEPGVYGWNELI